MFGAISKLFRKSKPAAAGSRSTTPQAPAAPARPARPVSKPVPQSGTPAATSPPRVAPVGSSGDVLQLSYSAIIKQVPQELWGRLAPAGVAGSTFTVFAQQILDQLPQGSVKVPFGDLRRNAPAGVFTNSAGQDSRLIDLPLQEVLAQLPPDILARRADQVRIEVSEDLPDLFGSKGERLAPLRIVEKKELSSAATSSRQNSPEAASAGNILPITPSFQTPPTSRTQPGGNTAHPFPTKPAAPGKSGTPRVSPVTARIQSLFAANWKLSEL